jgi:hypothetical protein
MTARPLLAAGALLLPLIAASHVAAQSLPPGSGINAISRAQRPGVPAPDGSRMSSKERPQGTVAPSRPARRKHPVNRSQDNG